jgi:uncharacterized membrane protein
MSYNILKLFHVLAVFVFLGNIFTGLFWMHIAQKTKDPKIISHTIKGVIKTDRLFTIPGYTIITAFGLFTAFFGRIPILHTGWILWSILAFTFSGIVFILKVETLQKRLLNTTIGKETSDNFDFETFQKEYQKWRIWGSIALLTPTIALIMMVLKIPR